MWGGLVPFKTTPLNIIKRGLAYSPAGLVKAMTLDTALMRMGRMSAAEMIDNLAQGLTGTGIMALGAFLASQGLVNGVAPENKKERDFKTAGGWQDYSINLPGGGTYTIDWAGPAVMALLAGVEAFHASEQEGFGFNEFLTAMGNITEPLFDTTMLSGINSAIQSATYAGSNPVTAAAGQAVSNFATQGIPTLSGQLARAMDPVRRTPYSDRQGAEGGLWEAAQRITSRIPGLSAQNPPYVDVWGRTQENPGGSTLGRLAYGMLSPGYYSPDRTTDADRLVEQIYETTGDAAALPALLNSSFTVNGEKVVLDAQQFTLGKQVKGQTSADMVEALEGYAPFEALEPAGQAAVLEGVYSLANTMAKTQVIPQLEEGLPDGSEQRGSDRHRSHDAGLPGRRRRCGDPLPCGEGDCRGCDRRQKQRREDHSRQQKAEHPGGADGCRVFPCPGRADLWGDRMKNAPGCCGIFSAAGVVVILS